MKPDFKETPTECVDGCIVHLKGKKMHYNLGIHPVDVLATITCSKHKSIYCNVFHHYRKRKSRVGQKIKESFRNRFLRNSVLFFVQPSNVLPSLIIRKSKRFYMFEALEALFHYIMHYNTLYHIEWIMYIQSIFWKQDHCPCVLWTLSTSLDTKTVVECLI